MGKVDLTINIESIKADLISSKVAIRKAVVKKIGKMLINDLESELFLAFEKEPKVEKNWEIQVEMIKALSRLKCQRLLPYVEKIINEDEEFDIITSECSTAYVRLKNIDGRYFSTVCELFKNYKYSSASGGIYALLYDKVILADNELLQLVELVNIYNHPNQRGIEDIRKLFVCYLSLYPKELIAPYLEYYKNIPSVQPHIIEEALKGKSHCANEY